MAQQTESLNTAKSATFSFFNARTISFIVLALAIAVSGYLSYLKIANANAVCTTVGRIDCGTVLHSAYSELSGIPIAWLGLATNLVIVGMMLFQNRNDFMREYGTLLIFGVVLFAFIYSVYLVYLQAFVIQAYCPWCLSHEALITILFGVWARETWLELGAT